MEQQKRRRTTLTKEIGDKVLTLRSQGLAIDKIADALTINTKSVQKIFIKFGIQRKGNITAETACQIQELSTQKLNATEIAEMLGIHSSTVSRFCNKRKITLYDARNIDVRLETKTKQQIIDLVAQGYGRAKIAEITGLGETTIKNFCKQHDLKSSNSNCSGKITEEIGRQIRDLKRRGWNSAQIGRFIGIHKSNVQDYCVKHNIIPHVDEENLKHIRKLRKVVSKAIHRGLRDATSIRNHSINDYLPYTMHELKDHLEKQFEPWMTWDNWGHYRKNTWDDNDPATWKWHIDHIVPHSEFIYASMADEAFQKCWALENLRPLNAKQNISEGARQVRHTIHQIIEASL
jgi:plasmid maintenance system antidote protein VapI